MRTGRSSTLRCTTAARDALASGSGVPDCCARAASRLPDSRTSADAGSEVTTQRAAAAGLTAVSLSPPVHGGPRVGQQSPFPTMAPQAMVGTAAASRLTETMSSAIKRRNTGRNSVLASFGTSGLAEHRPRRTRSQFYIVGLSATTGKPAAFHSGSPSSRRRTQNPRFLSHDGSFYHPLTQRRNADRRSGVS